MNSLYPTNFSDTSNLPKKDIKLIESKFPFVPPEDVKYEICGQIVHKNNLGSNIKFCPICDYPMIIRIINYPCEHVMCYECSQPDKGFCYICEGKIEKTVRIKDMTKLYECDYPDCFKFFESNDKLKLHKSTVHGISYENNMNFSMNIMNNRLVNPQYINPMMAIGNYMMPQTGGLTQQQPNANPSIRNNNIAQMNPLNNNMLHSNLNNIINSPSNLNNIPGNNIS